jgi:nucleotide-binding universal stress UspA family protein
MMKRILVAVDDSAPALAAAAYAIEIARTQHAQLNFVTVSETDREGGSILRHVKALSERAGVDAVTTRRDGGQPFDVILDQADEWDADLIVVGRSDLRRPGQPYVGSQTEHLLEFTRLPVVVVPGVVAS